MNAFISAKIFTEFFWLEKPRKTCILLQLSYKKNYATICPLQLENEFSGIPTHSFYQDALVG